MRPRGHPPPRTTAPLLKRHDCPQLDWGGAAQSARGEAFPKWRSHEVPAAQGGAKRNLGCDFHFAENKHFEM